MSKSLEKQSRQTERTKRDLKRSFTRLIREKGYSAVSITDIVALADYNRTTFYLHYQDKEAIKDELRQEMYAGIKLNSIGRFATGKEITIGEMRSQGFEVVQFIKENHDYFSLLLQEDTIPGAYRDIPLALFEVFDRHFIFTGKNEADINSSAQKLYMAHGTAGLILEWIRTDYQMTPEELSHQLLEILRSFSKGFRVRYTDVGSIYR